MTPAVLTSASWFIAGETAETGRACKVPVNVTPFRVGRRRDLPLSLSCLTVSKLHAELIKDVGDLWVRDLQSMNGTYVNGRRIHTDHMLTDGDLLQFGNVVFQVGQDSGPVEVLTVQGDAAHRARKIREFVRMMDDRSVLAFFQPIVRMDTLETVGYESLSRSSLAGLDTPKAMFQTAAALNVEAELSRIMRSEGIQSCIELPGTPNLFVNTHPAELDQPGLLESLREIRAARPDLVVTLEMHEAAVTGPGRMTELRSALSDLDMRLAYDDFGAGQSRLIELVAVPPDYVKFDLSLIRGIDQAPLRRQRMLSTLVSMVRDAGIVALAEGVESESESRVCSQIGFELAQGFHFGPPKPAGGLVRDDAG